MDQTELDLIIEKIDSLLESNQLSGLHKELVEMNEVDIAQALEGLEPAKMILAFRVLPKDISASVFSYFPSDAQQVIIQGITDKEVAAIIEDLYLDDAVDFLEELPANVVTRLLRNTTETTRNLINQFLIYPDDSAGTIMTIEYIKFRPDQTVREAMGILRRTGVNKEMIYTCYVIDEHRKLIGHVELKELLFGDENEFISELMDGNVIGVKTLDEQEFVADTARKYDLLVVPVVDNEGRMVGIITADDVMDVIEEENTKDIEMMSALVPSEDEYLKTSVWGLAKNRIPWLMILMISATFTGQIIHHFEQTLATLVGLTAFIPMLMDTGGNSGSQASTLIIRGLALGEVQYKDTLKVLWREVRVALICGLILAVVNYLRLIFFTDAGMAVSLVVSLSLFATVIIAKSIGCTLPMLAKKIGLDPALMASPMITTIVDACSLVIYFTVATRVLMV